ncbi:hypothetical protein [Boseongicola aestuarii]|uniref:Phasin domain-containing protein n=1 Tax=Boseongicola aestuarii TaxID=1470561 RepID=A0A238J671_9RHOB|nr:hypothetical protein [Boseongicola aestuarii]SMX25841.1 hypothetical protein BOA8489_03986 [Boseongicola aestuarii]
MILINDTMTVPAIVEQTRKRKSDPMTSTEKRATSAPSPKSAQIGGFMAPKALPLLQAQLQMAEEFKLFAERWTDRRRDAVQSLMKASGDTRPSDRTMRSVPEIMQTWQETSVQCVSEDVSDWIALWSTCSRIMTAGEIDVVSDLANAAGLTSKPDKLPTRIPV